MAEIKGYEYNGEPPRTPRKRVSERANLTGRRIGRLLVIEDLGVAGDSGFRLWGCICDCGKKKAIRSRELLKNDARSCGCLQAEMRATYGGRAASNKLPYGHASRNELLSSYKKSARDRNIEWHLSDEEFFEIVSSPCAYCGTPPDSIRKPNKGVNGEFTYSGVDRVDNGRGYFPDNVVSCCWNCNRAKGMMKKKDFLAWVDRLSRNTAARSARFEFGESGAR